MAIKLNCMYYLLVLHSLAVASSTTSIITTTTTTWNPPLSQDQLFRRCSFCVVYSKRIYEDAVKDDDVAVEIRVGGMALEVDRQVNDDGQTSNYIKQNYANGLSLCAGFCEAGDLVCFGIGGAVHGRGRDGATTTTTNRPTGGGRDVAQTNRTSRRPGGCDDGLYVAFFVEYGGLVFAIVLYVIRSSTSVAPRVPLQHDETGARHLATATAPPYDAEIDDEALLADVSLIRKLLCRGLAAESYMDVNTAPQRQTEELAKSFQHIQIFYELLKGLKQMGVETPSKLQQTILPLLCANPTLDMIIQGPASSGKTTAFLIAILNRVDRRASRPQMLCLSPTVELAALTGEMAKKMAKFCPDITIHYAVRGEEIPRGHKLIEHIIIGTPAQIIDWALKFEAFDLKQISVLAIDEGDVIATQRHHQDQCIIICKQLSSKCQMLFFSAVTCDEPMKFAEEILPSPRTVVRYNSEQEPLGYVDQHFVRCDDELAKIRALTNIVKSITVQTQTIIFCRCRKTAVYIGYKLCMENVSAAVLSGDLTVEQRVDVLNRFVHKLELILISTSVHASEIVFESVGFVINFDLPGCIDTYLRRIGRTTRLGGGRKGVAINLFCPHGRDLDIINSIEDHFHTNIRILDSENIAAIAEIVP